MRISASQYDAFWRCPERYRLGRAVVPAETPRALRQGRAFHAGVEALRRGLAPAAVEQAVRQGRVGAEEPELHIPVEEAEVVMDWLRAYDAQCVASSVVSVETWFEVPLPRGHVLVGRVDALVRDEAGRLWVSELKTDARPSEDRIAREWRRRMQFRAEVLGAQAFTGEPVCGLRVEVLPKTGAHRLLTCEFRYEPAELAAAGEDLALTAGVIEMLRAASPDGPWPHPALLWPCAVEGACEYEAVCQTGGTPNPDGRDWVATPVAPVPRGICSNPGESPSVVGNSVSRT